MCGIVAAITTTPVNQVLFDALTVIQHRGQDAAGIVTCENGRLYLQKGRGLIRDVMHSSEMRKLKGNIGIAHVRYPTAGGDSNSEAQPFYVNSPYGITLAHNGNLTNAEALKQSLAKTSLRHLNTSSDSEILLNVLAYELQKSGHFNLTIDDIFTAVKGVHQYCRGAYAVVAMITDQGLIGFRDPHGIRPLCYGKRETEQGIEYMIASESAALDCLGFSLVDDIAPGEVIYITNEGEIHRRECVENPLLNPCLFEIVYLARPDSTIDHISIYKARLHMGEYLAQKILKEKAWQDIDVVVPIPETSRPIALQLAMTLNVKYREAFVKNRYIGRTFIMPGQAMRKKSIRQKLNTIELEFKGKNVLLVDDSIVRGNTSEQIVLLARNAGANKVYFASAAPPVRYPNVYGIDIPARSELIAHNRSVEQVCQLIGADGLIYQDLEDLIACAKQGNSAIERFEDSVFSGDYVTGDIDEAYLDAVEKARNDDVRALGAISI